MSASAKAAATVQNNVLLVQYSHTGSGSGNLFAILLPNIDAGAGPVSLPFKVPLQAPDISRWIGQLSFMTLATVPSSSSSSTPGSTPPSPPTTSSESVQSNAVIKAAPFRDFVLALNDPSGRSSLWHVKPPPPATSSESAPSPWTASIFAPNFFPNPRVVSVSSYTARGPSAKAGILTVTETVQGFLDLAKLEYPDSSESVSSPPQPNPATPGTSSGNIGSEQAAAWTQTWKLSKQPWLASEALLSGPVHFAKVATSSLAIAGQCPSNQMCLGLFPDPPQSTVQGSFAPMPPSPCLTSTSSSLVVVSGDLIETREFSSPAGNSTKFTAKGGFQGPVIACASFDRYIVAVVQGANTTPPQPTIHLFDMKARAWIKTQLVEAERGTFSDDIPLPPPPTTGGGGGGDGGKGGNGGPGQNDTPSSISSSSRVALIAGIAGGVALVAVLAFVGFCFYRRRQRGGAKKKPLHLQQHQHLQQNMYGAKPLASHDALHKQQRMPDSDMRAPTPGGGGGIGNQRGRHYGGNLPGANDTQETIVLRSIPPLKAPTSSSNSTPTPHGDAIEFDTCTMSSVPLTANLSLLPVSGTVGISGDKGEISDREIQAISLRPQAGNNSRGNLADDDDLEIVTHVGRSRSNIRGGNGRNQSHDGGGSSSSSSPGSGMPHRPQRPGRNDPSRSMSGRGQARKDSMESETTASTEPLTPGMTHAQLILQESQRGQGMNRPPVPNVNPHYGAYPSQGRRQQYPSQRGNY